MKKIILIKLGGSLITEKDKPYTTSDNAINNIAKQLKEIISIKSDYSFLLGNGAGSFGHYAAKKYHIKKDSTLEEQAHKVSMIQDSVARLNRIVINSLLQQNIPACSITPSSMITSKNGKKQKIFTGSLFGFLRSKRVPVIYGDIIYDEKIGHHIFSTEDLFTVLIPEIIKNQYHIEKIIHLTTVPGVLNKEKEIIPVINKTNFQTIKKYIFQTKGFDVTGGMLHKIDTALSFAKKGIPTYVIQGNKERLLTNVILNKEFIGTKIVY